MPPKPKFGKAEIINAGLTIAKNEGLDQVTARSIAKTLGSSVCPVFSYFDNMEHLKNEIVVAAKAEYKKYQVKTISPVEQEYLNTIKEISKEIKKEENNN